jgi:hypothetical protein
MFERVFIRNNKKSKIINGRELAVMVSSLLLFPKTDCRRKKRVCEKFHDLGKKQIKKNPKPPCRTPRKSEIKIYDFVSLNGTGS